MSMRRRSREVSVFGASALDLFASALAAFIIIALMVLPFFLKYDEVLVQQVADLQGQLDSSQQQLEAERAALAAANAELDQTQQALQACQQQRETAESELAQCIEDLSTTFLTILIRWDNANDVDLHVVDPAGNEFYYAQSTFPGVPGELTEDVVDGPGVEVYEEANVRLGTFRVIYNLYSNRAGPVLVGGAVYSRQGRQELPDIRLSAEGGRVAVARITVSADGTVTLVPER